MFFAKALNPADASIRIDSFSSDKKAVCRRKGVIRGIKTIGERYRLIVIEAKVHTRDFRSPKKQRIHGQQL
jgi:hypothetical protein